VSTPVPVVQEQPPSRIQSRRLNPWLARAVGALIAFALLFPAAAMTAPAPVQANSCTGWTSTVVPPDTIRVLRRDGVVETVPFKRYVRKVMASGEWSPSLPKALLRAGAQATKQFAWYHSLKGNHRKSYVTADGQCYDVTATTKDQLYKPGAKVYSAHRKASNAIWDLSLHRNNKFILTPYRAGTKKECASDVDGKRLYAKSARRCANKLGWSAKRILRTYYTGDYEVALVSTSVGAALSPEAAWATTRIEVFLDDADGELSASGPFISYLRVKL
jgi:hypothetical protein